MTHSTTQAVATAATPGWTAAPGQYTRWDWRAAANFVGGGTGAGMLLAATLFAPSTASYRVQAGLGLAIVAIGLLCIMAKLGRPARALNIFRHAKGSWMTREGFAMPTLFGCGALSLWQPAIGAMAVIATLSALVFLYCQARILNDAKGIPAWSIAEIVPLIIVTGLAEGVGLAAATTAFVPGVPTAGGIVLLVVAVVLRHVAWRRYRAALVRADAPAAALAALAAHARRWLPAGDGLPLLLAAAGIVFGGTAGTVLVAAGGVLAALGGWAFKVTLLTRAGHYRPKSVSLAAGLARARARS